MNFPEMLVELNRESYTGYRMFDHIDINKYRISIQASNTHYCTPRDLIDKEEYKEWEIAMWHENAWLNAEDIEEHLENFIDLEIIKECYMGDTVGAYVPTETIERLLRFLKNKNWEKESE